MSAEPQHPVGTPAEPEDGLNVTLIRWMLSLTPAERLAVLQGNVKSILELRELNRDI